MSVLNQAESASEYCPTRMSNQELYLSSRFAPYTLRSSDRSSQLFLFFLGLFVLTKTSSLNDDRLKLALLVASCYFTTNLSQIGPCVHHDFGFFLACHRNSRHPCKRRCLCFRSQTTKAFLRVTEFKLRVWWGGHILPRSAIWNWSQYSRLLHLSGSTFCWAVEYSSSTFVLWAFHFSDLSVSPVDHHHHHHQVQIEH